MVGLDYEVGPGTASAAYQSRDTAGTTTSNYEFYYDYPINDGVSIKAGIFVETDRVKSAMADDALGVSKGQTTADRTGYMVETTFSF